MAYLSSPDAAIQHLLDRHALLHQDMQAYLDANKFVTRKIMPGVWAKFLESTHGAGWRNPGSPADNLAVVLPTCVNGLCTDAATCQECSMCAFHCRHTLDDEDYFTTRICNQCGNTFSTTRQKNATVCPVCYDQSTRPAPVPTTEPEDDLFDVIARGLKDRLKPQAAALDEDRVRQLIDYALKAEALHKTHRLLIKSDEESRLVNIDLPLPRWFERVYKLAKCRVHTLLVGPRGCGKTMTGELLAKALDLPLYTISLSAGVSEGVLQGWLHPSKTGLLFEYNRSRFVKAYQEGGVVLLDELDAADSNMLMILNAALANGKWEIPLRGEDAEALVKHPDFVCLAAANTQLHGADRVYVGRNQLDGATIDRFAMGRITVDYDEQLEREAFERSTVEFGQRLRARCRAQKGWTRDVSTRNIADACKLQAQLNLEESWFSFFEDWQDADCQKVGALRDRDSMSVTLE